MSNGLKYKKLAALSEGPNEMKVHEIPRGPKNEAEVARRLRALLKSQKPSTVIEKKNHWRISMFIRDLRRRAARHYSYAGRMMRKKFKTVTRTYAYCKFGVDDSRTAKPKVKGSRCKEHALHRNPTPKLFWASASRGPYVRGAA